MTLCTCVLIDRLIDVKQNRVRSAENQVRSAVNGQPASDKLRQVIADNPALVRPASTSRVSSVQQPATEQEDSTSEEDSASEVQIIDELDAMVIH